MRGGHPLRRALYPQLYGVGHASDIPRPYPRHPPYISSQRSAGARGSIFLRTTKPRDLTQCVTPSGVWIIEKP